MKLAIVHVEDTDDLIRMETIKLDILRYNLEAELKWHISVMIDWMKGVRKMKLGYKEMRRWCVNFWDAKYWNRRVLGKERAKFPFQKRYSEEAQVKLYMLEI